MSTVRVILLEDIPELGRAGDIVETSEGHARNKLFPEGLAALADDTAVAQAQEKQQAADAAKADELTALQSQAEALDGSELTLQAKVKDGDDIFGSVTAKNICDELKNQAGVTCKPKDIDLPEPLVKLGSYDVTVRLGLDIEAAIRVSILPEPGSESVDDDD